MREHLERWQSLTLSPADRAILDQMEEELSRLNTASDGENNATGFERSLDAIQSRKPGLGMGRLDIADAHEGNS